MGKERSFSFDDESARLNEIWRTSADSFLPLPVAAAITFHRAQGGIRTIATRQDFDDALNIAASALARMIPIYASDAQRSRVAVDLSRQTFARGATELRSPDAPPLAGLCVSRSDLLGALAEVRRRGVPFSLIGRHVSPRHNGILAAIPMAEYQRLASAMELVPLELGQCLYEPGEWVHHLFFVVSGVVSRIHVTADGQSTEIAVIGREGVVGLAALLGGGVTVDRTVTQVAGHAYRIAAPLLVAEFRRGGELQDWVLRYLRALMTQIAQTAVCNRHHAIEQQLCRWLLLTLDRVEGADVVMTQELISQMLGVRRAGITEAAKRLQAAGLVETQRGRIRVLDRPGLEARACDCYSALKRETERILSRAD